jgi:hypothetical protein
LKMDRKTGEIRREVREKGISGGDGDNKREQLKWTKELEKEFFERHEEYSETVQKKLLRVEREMYGRNLEDEEGGDDDSEEEEERSSRGHGSGPHSHRDGGYYYQPQRSVGSTWSSGGEKKETLRRSLSAGRYGTMTRNIPRRGGEYQQPIPSSSSLRRVTQRDENEYLFRYRR